MVREIVWLFTWGGATFAIPPQAADAQTGSPLMLVQTDGDNYYIARANALENNVSLYHTTNGRRNTIKYVNAPVAKNRWHTLKVDFSGNTVRVVFDGKLYIEQKDNHISGAGAVGVWTKADSITAFDDFSYTSATDR